ncbi:hypothetical protein SERLADRAFT_431662 [Serpula lacrymans var. lacrymans S7.9]|uniref:Uncharacterized protein n=1 Tax=Serpula lacrymans var. lacrymans (strain S7.9) TaxID=578457 RepID=F8NDA8_SERL9|nr:uncharacterized protein SERLADRAFT_431662 [Serpula lacrymans var. lacrymans S7.9]EGO30192.1 hypothetical protein SERLADRAFT_431662 [Serpula lacrymans var. lacrymans S7.9]
MNNTDLETLKKGLGALKKSVMQCKAELEAHISCGQSISEEDKNWLDGPANLIDKQCDIEALISYYNQGLQGLDKDSQLLVEKLRELRGGESKIVRKKKSSKLKCSPRSNSNPTKPAPVSQFNTGKKQRATLAIRIEPNDQGIIRCFKAHYWAAYISEQLPNITRASPQAASMKLISSSSKLCGWLMLLGGRLTPPHSVTVRRRLEFYPTLLALPSQPSILVFSLLYRDTDSLVHAKKAVEEALDALQATGALQKVNRMYLREIWNPEEEHWTALSMSDVEIVETVMAESRSEDTNAGAGGSWDNKEDALLSLLPCAKRSWRPLL